MSEYERYLADYEVQLLKLKETILDNSGDKHSMMFAFAQTGNLAEDRFYDSVNTIKAKEGDSDFHMQSLIRILCLSEDSFPNGKCDRLATYKQDIDTALKDFPFWPTEATRNMDKIVFWSENHLFMTLCSAYLYFQYKEQQKGNLCQDTAWEAQHIECYLLRFYLTLHLHPLFHGVYEVNSHVYLPYSLVALFNLFDFAIDPSLRSLAEGVIDIIVEQVMTCTDPLYGVANLAASARAFARTRQRNFDHNINQLINLMNAGRSANPFHPSAIVSSLLLTSWRPKLAAFQALHHHTGGGGSVGGRMITIHGNHRLEDLPAIYEAVHASLMTATATATANTATSSSTLDLTQLAPFLWSAGLITHPSYADHTRRYCSQYHLTNNVHLWPVFTFFLTNSLFTHSMESYAHFSTGQLYADIEDIAIYKDPSAGLLLSCFPKSYNAHVCGYQQFPWCINFAGVPLWSNSGLGSESIAGFGIQNTHNPAVQLASSSIPCMLISYLAPKMLTSTIIVGNLFAYKVRFFWPEPFFTVDYGCLDYVSPVLPTATVTTASSSLATNIVPATSAISSLAATTSSSSSSSSAWSSLFGSSSSSASKQPPPAHKLFWRIAQRDDCYIALLCTQSTHLDTSPTKDAEVQPFSHLPMKIIPRIVCEAKYHSWIVICGTKREFASIEEFIAQRVKRVYIQEEYDQKSHIYQIQVKVMTNVVGEGGSGEGGVIDQLCYSYNVKSKERLIP